ncbi:hypothetical protein [Lacipirellula limnantheis]|uniref:Uncharacterized protein n=1 Tax=Lacipirellula limnantheis TaxID=2528024 RepID=A0A517U565_9BACT|nr:hypothetical protein [Lacipirellula limnantheis]QDT75747.1 hypothetical protein I41_49890 [Lacipirellula limnantheis]
MATHRPGDFQQDAFDIFSELDGKTLATEITAIRDAAARRIAGLCEELVAEADPPLNMISFQDQGRERRFVYPVTSEGVSSLAVEGLAKPLTSLSEHSLAFAPMVNFLILSAANELLESLSKASSRDGAEYAQLQISAMRLARFEGYMLASTSKEMSNGARKLEKCKIAGENTRKTTSKQDSAIINSVKKHLEAGHTQRAACLRAVSDLKLSIGWEAVRRRYLKSICNA